MKPWAQLAVQYDEVEYVHFPVLVSAKLNGVRAKWDGTSLVSRQNKVWKECTLPTLFAKLRAWSKSFPGIVLDGELYSHGCPWQILEGITSINRQAPHGHEHLIDLHVFDIISDEPSEKRQEKLSSIYDPWVATSLVTNSDQLFRHLNATVEAGFEGLMLLALGTPYVVGRSEALIKLKPWRYGTGKVVGLKEGKDKYVGMLGALEVEWQGIRFFVSGGLSDEQRDRIWRDRALMIEHMTIGKTIPFKYRDLSNKGIPLQPQLVKL